MDNNMRIEPALQSVIEGVSASNGQEFFNKMVQLLAEVTQADICFIARVDPALTLSKTIAVCAHGQLAENMQYELADTPCENVLYNKDSVYPSGVCQTFPQDLLLQQLSIEGYIGASLFGSNGELLGIVVALYHQPIAEPSFTHTLFQIFTGRIGAEIERTETVQELEALNLQLEQRVKARTYELEQALQELQASQRHIIEQEKMASLGGMVAGVAHEINTPLGIAISGTSLIQDHVKKLQQGYKDDTLSEEDFEQILQRMDQAISMSLINLNSAARLIRSFKQVAVDQTNLVATMVDLASLLESVVMSIHAESKRYPVEISHQIPAELRFESYAGDLTQVFVNLLLNSLRHGFPNSRQGRIVIKALPKEDGMLQITVCDDGIGIPVENRTKVFEPFFTTNRAEGGSGLGLHIVYNIVTQKLGGRILLEEAETPTGCCLRLVIPMRRM